MTKARAAPSVVLRPAAVTIPKARPTFSLPALALTHSLVAIEGDLVQRLGNG